MSDSTPTPKLPAAVRLARVAFPYRDWKPSSGGSSAIAKVESDLSGAVMIGFCLGSLNDLHEAERRVCAAGYRDGHEGYINTLCGVCDDGCPVTATAPQRAAALIAFLDAHPAVEERLAHGE